ncbi:hypothetical protein HY024_04905, partial [Candidatus Curtissbacteria bacterium]|nr:hypothetical protein [Candidatus Curtissbacteria bacterium]
EAIPQVLSRAVFLTKKLAGGKIASELIDIYPVRQKAETIGLSAEHLNSYMGIDFKLTDSAKILTLLGFVAKVNGETISAIAPTWRANDIEGPEDLIEEIARVYGYHNLPNALPSGDIPNEPPTDLTRVISLKNSLKYLGLTEVVSYSIISAEMLKLTETKPQDAVELSNPLSSEWQFMRPSIIPSLADVIAKNQNLANSIKIFEVAKTYTKNGSDLPTQDLKLAISMQNSSFYQVKGLIENVFQILGREVEFKKMDIVSPLSEKDFSAFVISHGKTVGGLGVLNQKVANHFGIEGSVTVAELNLSTIYSLPTTVKNYHPIAKFPPVIEDISAIFDEKTPVVEIISVVKEAGKPLVKSIEILDIYEDAKIGKGKKSVTLRLQYQKSDATPTNEEVRPVQELIIKHLESKLAAIVRK